MEIEGVDEDTPVGSLSDEQLVILKTIPLNKMFKKQNTPEEEINAIKAWRRIFLVIARTEPLLGLRLCEKSSL